MVYLELVSNDGLLEKRNLRHLVLRKSAMRDETAANLGARCDADRFRLVVDAVQFELPDKSRSFTHLDFDEDVPERDWRKVLINGTEHKPVPTTLNTAFHRSNWLVVEGLHDYKGLIAEFV